MKAHGAQLSLSGKEYKHLDPSAQTSSGYRNLFGDARPEERYQGFVTAKQEPDRDQTREMFKWLAERFGRSYAWPDGRNENRRIPAGYTYLAQFVIHDTMQSLADLPDVQSDTEWLRNDRSGRLVLDTIYGKGVSADPLLYGGCPALPDARGFLRIGGRENDAGRRRDLPRSPCPYSGKPANSDVLIADARNDDNVIIAQLTALFHLLHNIVYGELYKRLENKYSDRRIFAVARKVVTAVYRKIVIEDLLARLLYPEVYERYSTGGSSALVDDPTDARMPLEFSHAAARFGHFMVRDQYAINGDLRASDTGLRSILQQTSSVRPWAMPLEAKWLIEWKRLFGPPGSPGLLYSRRLGPELARVLVQNDLFRNSLGGSGALPYIDFRRGSESNLKSVAAIVAHDRLPNWVRNASPLLRNGGIDAWPLVNWLEVPFPGVPAAPQEYIDCLKADIPLLLFVVLEAAETTFPSGDTQAKQIEKGECLGPIGSFIVAEFIFGEYWRTHSLIEDDSATKEALDKLFSKGVPGSMPTLIEEIARRKAWDNVDAKFW